VTIAGTLTIPKGDGPFPAVLLIAGSGPQNRDEALFGHKPFLVLADYLTRHGIAVLRVDKRGIGKSTGDAEAATTHDFAADATKGVQFLKSRKEIDPKHIGLLGHSEGGLIAPMVAAESPSDVAFVVLLAAPGVPCDQLMFAQEAAVARAAGVPEDAIASSLDLNKRVFDVVMHEKDRDQAEKKVRELLNQHLSTLTPEQREAMGGKAFIDAQLRMVLSPWFRDFLSTDPKPTLMKVKCAVLALNGGKDTQVVAEQNIPAIKAALAESGNKDVTVMELPNLNHLFQTCKTGSPSEYGRIEETMSPEVLQTVAEWITSHTK
jgi:pimeloyl-ACP methyl ester carboxylesterase